MTIWPLLIVKILIFVRSIWVTTMTCLNSGGTARFLAKGIRLKNSAYHEWCNPSIIGLFPLFYGAYFLCFLIQSTNSEFQRIMHNVVMTNLKYLSWCHNNNSNKIFVFRLGFWKTCNILPYYLMSICQLREAWDDQVPCNWTGVIYAGENDICC